VDHETKLALVGAGYIADVHAEVLNSLKGVSIEAVVDPNIAAAEGLAKRYSVPVAASNLEACFAQTSIDCAHVLVPPPLHAKVATEWLNAGTSVFLEKPLAVSAHECRALLEQADIHRLKLGVNQNFVYHPAYQRLKAKIDAGEIGRLDSVSAVFSMPLRQLDAGQLGHWMFAEVGNILLEQAVHPLSQLEHMAGPLQLEHVTVRDRIDMGGGQPFYKVWDCLFTGRDGMSVSLQFRVGSNFPCFEIHAIGSDGIGHSDMVRNWASVLQRSRWPDAYDHRLNSISYAQAISRQARKGFRDFIMCQTGLKKRSDPFFQSMDASIAAFHSSCAQGRPIECDGVFGANIVALCEEIAHRVMQREPAKPQQPQRIQHSRGQIDVALLGGTGFIGRHLVKQLVDAGHSIRVMARGVRNLPDIFHHENVELVQGNVRNIEDVRQCVKGVKYVVNLAHGGGGADRDAIYQALVGSALNVAEICLKEKVEQLIFISSIAALYLGDQSEIITSHTPVDQKSEKRNDYAWAKAEAERELLHFQKEKGLNIHIQRPGLVVGQGTSPLHSGLGFFNNEQHCIGWNRGYNPLPFVLAEDTASAIVAALGRDDLAGICDNIVGDVRPNARDYYQQLKRISGRPLHYHPQYPWVIQLSEIAKWIVKRISGRKVPFPPYRDILSRGLTAQFDCADAKNRLIWSPCCDENTFMDQAIKYALSPKDDSKGASF